jgi:hypothetical protein
MKFTMRAMKTYPSAQSLGFFDVELRVQWLERYEQIVRLKLRPSRSCGTA